MHVPGNNPPTMGPAFPVRQGGAVLIVSLILLLVMTLIGVFAMRGTILEERMAGNTRDRDLAFQSAEAALRAGERELLDSGFSGANSHHYDASNETTEAPNWRDREDDWSDGASIAISGIDTASPPRYRIERQPSFEAAGEPGTPQDPNLEHLGEYRIYSRSRGGSGEADVVLRSGFLL